MPLGETPFAQERSLVSDAKDYISLLRHRDLRLRLTW